MGGRMDGRADGWEHEYGIYRCSRENLKEPSQTGRQKEGFQRCQW